MRSAEAIDEKVALRERDQRIGEAQLAAERVDAMHRGEPARREGEVVVAVAQNDLSVDSAE
jgi:hypothetical protein